MLLDSSQLPLFLDHSMQLSRSHILQHHIPQPVRGIRHGEQIGKLTFRLGSTAYRDQLTRWALTDASLRRVNQISQFFGQLDVPELRLVRGHLHRDRQELSIIASDVRFDERLELVRASHRKRYDCGYGYKLVDATEYCAS